MSLPSLTLTSKPGVCFRQRQNWRQRREVHFGQGGHRPLEETAASTGNLSSTVLAFPKNIGTSSSCKGTTATIDGTEDAAAISHVTPSDNCDDMVTDTIAAALSSKAICLHRFADFVRIGKGADSSHGDDGGIYNNHSNNCMGASRDCIAERMVGPAPRYDRINDHGRNERQHHDITPISAIVSSDHSSSTCYGSSSCADEVPSAAAPSYRQMLDKNARESHHQLSLHDDTYTVAAGASERDDRVGAMLASSGRFTGINKKVASAKEEDRSIDPSTRSSRTKEPFSFFPVQARCTTNHHRPEHPPAPDRTRLLANYEIVGHPSLQIYRLRLPADLLHLLDKVVRDCEEHASHLPHGWCTNLYSLTKQDIALREAPHLYRATRPIARFMKSAITMLYDTSGVKMDRNQPHVLKYSIDDEAENRNDDGERRRRHTGVELHHDKCDYTANLMLSRSTSYGGGGTYFPDADLVVRLNFGEFLLHPGKLVHGGVDITHGARYLMIIFANSK